MHISYTPSGGEPTTQRSTVQYISLNRTICSGFELASRRITFIPVTCYQICPFQQRSGGPLWFLIIHVINNKLHWFMPVTEIHSSLAFVLSFIVSSSLDVLYVTGDKKAAGANRITGQMHIISCL
jgi:hypothetical protein